jgi:hypothetical protein
VQGVGSAAEITRARAPRSMTAAAAVRWAGRRRPCSRGRGTPRAPGSCRTLDASSASATSATAITTTAITRIPPRWQRGHAVRRAALGTRRS